MDHANRLSSIDVKRLNRLIIYRAILREDKVSRNDLAVSLGMSLPTVAQNVKELLDRGLIQEIGTMASTGGRKPSLIAPLAQARLALGLDITQNHISLAVVDLKGQILAHQRTQKKFVLSEDYFASVAARSSDFLATHLREPSALLGYGVAFPGIVSEDGLALLNSHMLNICEPQTIRPPFRIEAPTRLFNDAFAACLSENLDETPPANFFYLTLSNTVGGAQVINGKILKGANQRGGEVGHVSLFPDGKQCYCGGKGHYDSYGSALSLAAPAGGRLQDFFAQEAEGNAEFAAILDAYLKNLALLIVNLRMCLDCDIVLGGYVGGFLGPYLQRVRDAVSALDSFQDNADYVRLCRHKMESTAVGSALYFIDKFISEI
ncbi:MAG: ROK family transcriptional regulator [Deltaproteobacteria bacterium]|jgi:predicted NBD/HSP70 family sugar kinase|nr:ROK family transcriptional regulator [Deltaproteobacteria bacterium]